jgi:hypothetical protein
VGHLNAGDRDRCDRDRHALSEAEGWRVRQRLRDQRRVLCPGEIGQQARYPQGRSLSVRVGVRGACVRADAVIRGGAAGDAFCVTF